MYKQKKTNDSQSKTASNSADQATRGGRQEYKLVDNRSTVNSQVNLQLMIEKSSANINRCQKAIQKNPAQRMIAINTNNLYYDKNSLGFKDDHSKKKGQKEGEWKTNFEDSTGRTATDIKSENFIGWKKMAGWGVFLKGAIKQKLENNSRIFEYTDYDLGSENQFVQALADESITQVLRPDDFTTETTDIKGA